MSNYRLCFLDPRGKIDTVEIVDCADDEHARILARDRLHAIGKYAEVEIWTRERCLRLDADDLV